MPHRSRGPSHDLPHNCTLAQLRNSWRSYSARGSAIKLLAEEAIGMPIRIIQIAPLMVSSLLVHF